MLTAPFLVLAATLALATWHGPGHEWAGLAVLVVWFFLCRSLGPDGQRRLLTAALVFSVMVAALAVVQVALWMPRARGPFVSPNYLGAYAALMFFLCCAGVSDQLSAQRRWVIGAATANLLSVALSQSRGAILALGAGLLVIAFQAARATMPHLAARGRLWPSLAALAAIAAVVAVFLIRPDTINSRGAIWRLGLQAAQQRLVTGWGQGGAIIGGLDHFYNIPLDLMLAGGIPALVAGAWLLTAAALRAKQYDPHHEADRTKSESQHQDQTGAQQPVVYLFKSHALLAFLAAWFVQGMFISGTPATWLTLVAVLGCLAHRNSIAATSTPDIEAEPATRVLRATSIQ